MKKFMEGGQKLVTEDENIGQQEFIEVIKRKNENFYSKETAEAILSRAFDYTNSYRKNPKLLTFQEIEDIRLQSSQTIL